MWPVNPKTWNVVIHHPGLQAGAYGGTGGTEAAGLEARGDILLALESLMSVVHASITHPSGVANRTAAATTGWGEEADTWLAGAVRVPFIPFSVETSSAWASWPAWNGGGGGRPQG
jgi:hypothetical protein